VNVTDRPPRPGRRLLIRALIAAIVTISLSATAVASAVLLEIHDVVNEFTGGKEGRTVVDVPEVDRAQAGDPRTFLLLGTDQRYSDRKAGIKPRSDTILLVRVDPDAKRIAVMSIPRDLKVNVPGAGTNKINAAYEIGGPRKTVVTIKKLFEDATHDKFPINNVLSVSFGGFRKAVNYVGGVYVDIDRRYYNDNTTAGPGENYATIDVKPGYQKLKGQDALDYVRYRHFDNDFFRAARQQDFLRQVSHQDAVRQLLDPSKTKRLARVFGRYFEVDKSFVSASNLIGLAQMGLYMAQSKAPVNEVPFQAYEA
jgi:LCP family protein required for cell wall assembly